MPEYKDKLVKCYPCNGIGTVIGIERSSSRGIEDSFRTCVACSGFGQVLLSGVEQQIGPHEVIPSN